MSFSVIARLHNLPHSDETVDGATHHDTYAEALREYRRLERERLPREQMILMLSETGCNVDTRSVQPEDDVVVRAVWSPALLRAQYPEVQTQIAVAGDELPTLQQAKYRLLDFVDGRRDRVTQADVAAFDGLIDLMDRLQDHLPVPFNVAFPDAPRGNGPDLDSALTPEESAELNPPFPSRDPQPARIQWSRGKEYPGIGIYLEGRVDGELRYRIRKTQVLRRKVAYVLEEWNLRQWHILLDSGALGKLKTHAAEHVQGFKGA